MGASDGLSEKAWTMIEEALLHGTITTTDQEGQTHQATLRPDDVLSLAQWLALHQPRKRRTVPRPEDFDVKAT